MVLNNNEIKKVFNFIIANKNVIISDYSLFTRDTLITLLDIINERRRNDFNLSKKQEAFLIKAFLTGDSFFDDVTPDFILKNNDCINVAIERDINSINYLNNTNITPSLKERIINLALNNKYILKYDSPLFLQRNYNIAFNSIKLDASSADYVYWYAFNDSEKQALVTETIKNGYILTKNSASFLKNNYLIVLNSINKNIKTIIYASENAKHNPEVFKYLLLNHYNKFTNQELEEQALSNFIDSEVLKYVLEKFNILNKNNCIFKDMFDSEEVMDSYINRYALLFSNGLKSIPTIASFKNIFEFTAENEWEKYRQDNPEDYSNIFGKICSELQGSSDFDFVLYNLKFMHKMERALKEKYNELLKNMYEYHKIIHSNNRVNIDIYRDKISELTALYVAISKEEFKKNKQKEYEKFIYSYFVLKSPLAYHKIIMKKQKKAFRDLYFKKDQNITNFLDSLVQKYHNICGENVLWQMINDFLCHDCFDLEYIITMPIGYSIYKRYQEASKLINRLNSNYLKYTDQELNNYLDIIKYDNNFGKYYYAGPTLPEDKIIKMKEYEEKERLFNQIKKDIIFKIKTIVVDNKITNEELNEVQKDFPFTDKYFKFNDLLLKDVFSLKHFINTVTTKRSFINPDSILNDDAYNALTTYVINNNIVWLLMLLKHGYNDELSFYFNIRCFIELANSMNDIVNFNKKLNFDLNKLSNIYLLGDLSECADEKTVAVLGTDIIEKLYREDRYTYNSKYTIVAIALELYSKMVQRNKSTVPLIQGKTDNYEYSMYDMHDPLILLSGINTNCCFKADGVDNDFLHYCALNKNGFIIKITDLYGNFVARASGFRNGNCVYINQLRTIYDKTASSFLFQYDSEVSDVIKTFKKACEDIVNTSQNNKKEKDKIEYVFVTKSYALSHCESNVSDTVQNKIGNYPMLNNSNDWINFVNNTKYLRECDEDKGFTTDYKCFHYPLICMASYKQKRFLNSIIPRDIKHKDVEAVYTRIRNNIIVLDKPNIDIIGKINRIRGTYCYLNKLRYTNIKIPINSLIIVGDNWYLIYADGKIFDYMISVNDEYAFKEYNIVKNVLKEYAINNKEISTTSINKVLSLHS